MEDFPRKDDTFKIIGACFEVYNEKGCGFLEPVYQACLEMEFDMQGLPFAAQQPIPMHYKGRPIGKTYEPDFICFGRVILEIKAASQLRDEHRAQVINYLNAAAMRVALLVNFGHFPKLQYERIVSTQSTTKQTPSNLG